MDWKSAPEKEIVCYCENVDKASIVDAIIKGSSTLSEIKKSTKACTGGRCEVMNPSGKCCSGDIVELIKIYSRSSTETESSCCCCDT